MGRNTGLKSFRTTVFRRFPRTGVPEEFESWSSYENFLSLLVRSQHRTRQETGWDVRPHPTFALSISYVRRGHQSRRTVAIAALTQAIVVSCTASTPAT